ncbi:moulting cycle domain-containing protein [Ditylenchus destructor]|nr:moulting cycle domain-containing protein [Ditylenchus destructor]
MLFIAFLCHILALLTLVTAENIVQQKLEESKSESGNSNLYSVDVKKLELLWHRAAVVAMLKLKAKSLLQEQKDNPLSRVLYEDCAKTARTAAQLSKCLVILLNAKSERGKEDFLEASMQYDPLPENGDLLSSIKQFWQNYFGRPSGTAPEYTVNPPADSDTKVSQDQDSPIAAQEFDYSDNIIEDTFPYRSRREALKMPSLDEPSENLPKEKTLKHVENLQKLVHYSEISHFCRDYLKRMSEDNSRMIHEATPNSRHWDLRVKPAKNLTILDEVGSLVNTILSGKGGDASSKLSILSPKLLSLLPSKKNNGGFLSPNLLNLFGGKGSADKGLISVPDLLKTVNGKASENTETAAWLDLLLDVSGTGAAVENALRELEPEAKSLLPAVLELERVDANWNRLHGMMTREQKRDMTDKGYAFLDTAQLELVYGSKALRELNQTNSLSEYAGMNAEQRELRLEESIRRLARLAEGHKEDHTEMPQMRISRSAGYLLPQEWENITFTDPSSNLERKNFIISNYSAETHNGDTFLEEIRQIYATDSKEDPKTDTAKNTGLDNFGEESNLSPVNATRGVTIDHEEFPKLGPHGPELSRADEQKQEEEERELIEFRTLEPFAMANRVGGGIALEVLTLSPHAFLSELASPEALIASTLSPRAFISSVLTPSALIARVLSPAAFRAEIISPRALTAFVLSPEALIAEVLSPKFLDARVLSPEVLIVKILSPEFLAPKVLSPEALGIAILSPQVLTPRIKSGEALLIEILSPHILSGGHSGESHEGGHESGEKEEGHGGLHTHIHTGPSANDHGGHEHHTAGGDGHTGRENHGPLHNTQHHHPRRRISGIRQSLGIHKLREAIAAREFS